MWTREGESPIEFNYEVDLKKGYIKDESRQKKLTFALVLDSVGCLTIGHPVAVFPEPRVKHNRN